MSFFVIAASKLPINFGSGLHLDYIPAIQVPSAPSIGEKIIRRNSHFCVIFSKKSSSIFFGKFTLPSLEMHTLRSIKTWQTVVEQSGLIIFSVCAEKMRKKILLKFLIFFTP